MSKSTRIWLAIIAVVSYVTLEAGLLIGLYRPEQQLWLERWVVYPSVAMLAVTFVLVSAPSARRYLIQPAVALLVIILMSDLQSATPDTNLAVLIGHAGAILWFVSSFMRYVTQIPPAHTQRGVLVKLAGVSLLLLELPFMLYLARQSLSWLERNDEFILNSLVLTTFWFGLVFIYIVWLNLRSDKYLPQSS